MAGMDPETLTVAFFAREEGRAKAPAALHKAVEAAGGLVAAEMALKARALPKWLAGQAAELGVELDDQGARALVAQVGERRQRLRARAREARDRVRPGRARSASRRSQASCASSSERRALDARRRARGRRREGRHPALIELRQQGERLPSLLYQMVRRVRDALAISEALAAGQPARRSGAACGCRRSPPTG